MNNDATANTSGNLTSGTNTSPWLDTIERPSFPSLPGDTTADVLVIGGGIAGITTAYCLTKAGRKIMLIEDGELFSGETGRTTAHVVNALDDFYHEIIRMHGLDKAKLAADSHTAAIRFVEQTTKELQIDCDFTRLDGYLFLHENDEQKTLDDELDATHKVGIPTTMLDHVPGLSNENSKSLHYPGQAQFHPLKYLLGLVKYITANGGTIYTHTRASSVKENEVKANDFTITAEHIVVATNSPINDVVTMHTKQHPYRTYVIGALVPKGAYEKRLWWDTGDPDSEWVTQPYHYVRLQEYSATHDLVISGGEDHKTGQDDRENKTQEQRYDHLITWTKQRFPAMQDVVYTWSGQVLEPVDSLAFIGKNPGDKNIYIITGDSGNGMTHGTIGGMLVADLIMGKENPWAELYDPSRITLKAAGDFIHEAANMAAQYVDYITAGDIKNQDDLQAGEGAIMNVGLRKIAVYKNEAGDIQAYTAVCPHLGCIVQWNKDEKSFDCPCHGSRFTCNGVVINGPAKTNLDKIELKD